jgi:four helix bundle protein
MARDFRKIKAWQLADDLVLRVYQLSRQFPAEELYGLVSQLRRAVASVPANIAEGSNRSSNSEFLQFLYIASGSMAEEEYFLHLSHRLGYLRDAEYDQLEEARRQSASTLQGLIKSVKAQTATK